MNPDKVQARKMVLIGVFLLAILSTMRDRKSQSAEGTYRVLWGVSVVGLFLSVLADFAPKIAGPFAILIVLGSLTHGGEQAIARALGMIAPESGAGAKPAKPATVVTRDKQGQPAVIVDPATGNKRAVQPAPAG